MIWRAPARRCDRERRYRSGAVHSPGRREAITLRARNIELPTRSDRFASLLHRWSSISEMLSLKPSAEVRLHKLLSARTTRQTQPCCPAFAFQADVDIEEWTASMLTRDPFGYKLQSRAIAREFELVSILQFPSLHHSGAELRTELIEVSLTFCRTQRRSITRKRRFGSCCTCEQ